MEGPADRSERDCLDQARLPNRDEPAADRDERDWEGKDRGPEDMAPFGSGDSAVLLTLAILEPGTTTPSGAAADEELVHATTIADDHRGDRPRD